MFLHVVSSVYSVLVAMVGDDLSRCQVSVAVIIVS